MKITENMMVEEVLNISDSLEKVLLDHCLNCTGCPGAMTETLREAAEAHGANLEKLLNDLNSAAGEL